MSDARQGTGKTKKKTFSSSRSLFCLPAGGFSDGQVSNAEAVDALELVQGNLKSLFPFRGLRSNRCTERAHSL